MNINLTIVGQIIVASIVLITALCYYLGRKKTENPILTTFIGFLLCFVPPLSLIYIAVLSLKKDIVHSEQESV